MTNCEQACRTTVQNYAKSGCGSVVKGSKVKHAWDAGSCTSGIGTEEFICA